MRHYDASLYKANVLFIEIVSTQSELKQSCKVQSPYQAYQRATGWMFSLQ